MKIDISDFDAAAFVAAHPNEYIVFLTGGWEHQERTGYYDCLLCFNGHRKRLSKALQDQRSSNSVMLLGAAHACSLLRNEHTVLHLITPTPLGFVKGRKGRGVNMELIQDVLSICEKKNIEIIDIDVFGGGDLIKDVVRGRMRV